MKMVVVVVVRFYNFIFNPIDLAVSFENGFYYEKSKLKFSS